MNDTLKDFAKTMGFFILLSVILIICLLVIAFFPYIDMLDNNHIIDNILHINAGSIIILTVLLVCVAYLQLHGLNRKSKANFLLKIDDRYSSNEIIRARVIIERIYREVNPSKCQIPEEIYIKKISDEIEKIRSSTKKIAHVETIDLLNLLDFLETLAFFTRKDYISIEEVSELLGNSLVFYFKIFRPWIYDRRVKHSNSSFYKDFESLVDKIESKIIRDKLTKTRWTTRAIKFFQ